MRNKMFKCSKLLLFKKNVNMVKTIFFFKIIDYSTYVEIEYF